MIKRILLFVLLGTSPVLAQIAAIQGHSFLGGTQAVTSGLKSSNYMQGIVPYATICVYNTGTTVPATIYANASGAPLSSCFTSNASISTDPGGWIFWAAINQGLDVVMSGGVSPNMYPAPVTISDLYPSTQIISGCGFGTVCLISQGGTGATTAAGALANLGGVALTVVTLPDLSLPYSQLSGTVPTWNQSTTGNAATATTATSVPYSGLTGTVPTWNQSTTGTAANITATSNSTLTTLPSLSLPYSQLSGMPSLNYLPLAGGTLTGPLNGTNGSFSGTVAAGTTTPTTIGSNGVLLNGVPALQSQTSLNNYYSGGAGNLTGTGYNNTANGYAALSANTTGNMNTANGFEALIFNTTGTNNNANGFEALYTNTTGYYNTANGMYALFTNTTGSNNTANGYEAGQYIEDGVTANQTSSNSVYEGFQAYPLASGDTNENVIGNTAIGHGSNTTTLGNASITDTYLAGTVHGTSFTGNAATLTGPLSGTSASFSGTVAAGTSVTSLNVNNTLEASLFSGGDQGAKINAAIAYAVTNNLPCHIALSTAGTISTAPNVLLGCALDIYAPQTIATTWTVYHHGTSIDFHGYLMTGNTGSAPVIDIGKASALAGTAGTVNTSGTAVTWVSGPTFADLDLGDQISIAGNIFNIASINSPTSITLTASAGTNSGAVYVAILDAENFIPNNHTPQPPTIKNFVVAAGTSTGDAIRNTFSSNVSIQSAKIFGAFANGYEARGAMTAYVPDLSCSGCVDGIFLDSYTFASTTIGSNANIFIKPNLVSSQSAGGSTIITVGSSGNQFIGARIEGNLNTTVINEGGGRNTYQFADYERNGTGSGSAYEIDSYSSGNTFIGPAQVQSYNTLLMAMYTGTVNNTVENLQFNCTGTSCVALSFVGTANGRAINNTFTAGIFNPPATGIEDSSNNYTVNNFTAVGTLYGNKLLLATARKGTFVCTAAGTITITNSLATATSDIVITMNTARGTITTPPAFNTPGNGTNFTVLCGATDTSTYNYLILD